MLWLVITLISYFILAGVYLVDRYLLTSTLPDHRLYTFYVGILAMIVLVVIPFIKFYIPPLNQLVFSIFTGFIFSFCLFWFYKSLNLFEASRIVPALGALGPIFTFLLVFLFSGGKELMNLNDFFAFILLILGTFLITLETEKKINWQSIKYASFTAFLFSLFLIFSKKVYLHQPFLNGLIWIKVGGFLFSLLLLIIYPSIRQKIFQFHKEAPPKKTFIIFVGNQIFGGGASLLQNWAIALAPFVYVPIITALEGAQYMFLLLIVIFISLKFPRILQEEISRQTIFLKISATFLISLGIAILALF